MRLSFELRDLAGAVDVVVERNVDPERLGSWPGAAGFPACTAEVSYAGRGYRAAMGWIQLVRSTDNRSGGREFEMDPFEPLGEVPHPFCFFGFVPTLFDAPSRESRRELDWLAHSFLCFIRPLSAAQREVAAILGFAWGFAIRGETITIARPAPLAPREWDGHLPLLRSRHPDWRFAAGYQER